VGHTENATKKESLLSAFVRLTSPSQEGERSFANCKASLSPSRFYREEVGSGLSLF